jgi:hypothetical protein
MANKVPWQKIKELAAQLAEDLWKSEESKMRRIIESAAAGEKEINVSFTHTIGCNEDLPTIRTKIAFSERFSATSSAQVEDPAQLTLGEKP